MEGADCNSDEVSGCRRAAAEGCRLAVAAAELGALKRWIVGRGWFRDRWRSRPARLAVAHAWKGGRPSGPNLSYLFVTEHR